MPTLMILGLVIALIAMLPAGVFSPVSSRVRDAVRGGTYAEQRVVTEYLALTRKAFPWQQLSLYESSEVYFRTHFAELDPRRPHAFGNLGAKPEVDIPTLMQVKAAGGAIVVRGRAAAPTLITNEWLPETASTAYQLTDRRAANVLVLCRVPLAAEQPVPANQGDVVRAEGLVLGAGIVPRLGASGPGAVIYMACSSIARDPFG